MNIFNHFCEENKTLLNLIKKELLQYNDINQNQLFNGVDTIIHKHTKNIEQNEALYKMQQSLAVLNHEIKIGEFNTKNNYVALTLDIDEVYYKFLYEKNTEEKNDEYGRYNKKDIDLLQIAINNFLVIKNELEDKDKAISTQLKLRKNESIVNLKNHSNSKLSSFIFSFSNDQQSQYENYEILKNAYDLNDSFECLLKNYPQHAMDFILTNKPINPEITDVLHLYTDSILDKHEQQKIRSLFSIYITKIHGETLQNTLSKIKLT